MGNPRSPVETPRQDDGQGISGRRGLAPIPGYGRLDGPVPVFYPSRLTGHARVVRDLLTRGSDALAEIMDSQETSRRGPVDGRVVVGRPAGASLRALVVADGDWDHAPREGRRPYPAGLPYFTRSVDPPVLVLPEELSPVFRPRTGATLPLAVWHELAHAFLLRGEVVRTPAWLGEFVAQAASAAVAREVGLPLEEHLARVDHSPGFTVRGFRAPAGGADQMKFQNLLLALGVAALEAFGRGFLGRLFRALWAEKDVVDRERAEELLAGALGPGGEEWLFSRREF